MMQIIDRYIFKELLKVFLLAIFVLTSVMFLDKMLYLTEMIFNKGVSFFKVIQLFIYLSPAFLVLTIPMSILVSSLITFNRLSADSEVIAMNAGGFSFYRLARPLAILSFIIYLLTSFLMIYALPWGNHSFKRTLFEILRSNANITIKERIFNDDFDGLLVYINDKNKNSGLMHGIFIADSRNRDNVQIVSAQKGLMVSDPATLSVGFILKNGTIHSRDENTGRYRLMNFTKYRVQIRLKDPTAHNQDVFKGNREMSIEEINKKIEYLKEKNKPYFAELVEIHKKFSIPFTCLILGLIGAPLGIKSSRSGRSGGFALSLIIILFYYVALIAGESFGDIGKIHPFIAMWSPNFIIGAAGAYLVKKTQQM